MAASRIGYAPASLAKSALGFALVTLLLDLGGGRALAEDPPPEPSEGSVVGQVVKNPVTGNTTVVQEIVRDPAGTPTANDPAFVRTADGFVFLVKSAGELVYNAAIVDEDTNLPLALTIVSIDSTTHEALLDATPETTGDRATLETRMTLERYNHVFSAQSSTDTVPVEPSFDSVGSDGVKIVQRGAFGGHGSWGIFFVPPSSGGAGGAAASVSVTTATTGNVVTPSAAGKQKIGIEAASIGGTGGNGGSSYVSFWSGRKGGDGGKAGTVTVTNAHPYTVSSTGTGMHGIHAYSIGGTAGNGGSGYAAPGGGDGGIPTNGNDVTVRNYGSIVTHGASAYGIYALSVSGNGGTGGSQWGLGGRGGAGGLGGGGGAVTVENLRTQVGDTWALGSIQTDGVQAHGIVAQSVGGTGGDAGNAWNLIVSLPDTGDRGGSGGNVTVKNQGVVKTKGEQSRGLFAQSVGGGGGTGSSTGGLFAFGGAGAGGGGAGTVAAINEATGTIETGSTRLDENGVEVATSQSDGIFVQSVAGSGGAGGDSGGLLSIGGRGSVGGSGNEVRVENLGRIATQGARSRGIVAQSIGGGGGDGGSSGGMVSVGGSGAGGGAGARVTVVQGGEISTDGDDSTAIVAQSIGGGGGNGGSAGSVGVFGGVAIGGTGSGGGAGGEVNLALQGKSATVASLVGTEGDRSVGIFAQSVGGGGGNGGGAVQATGGFGLAASVAVGGDGGKGGAGGKVTLSPGAGGPATVTTKGVDSTGLFLQSVGGGGGNGGYAVSVATSAGPVSGALSLAIGGQGKTGGDGGEVRVGRFDDAGNLLGSGFDGTILTDGARSTGLLAQSVGGGGGNGGLAVSVAGSGSLGFSASVGIGLGGDGGAGGVGGAVTVGTNASVTTIKEHSTGMLVQSVGGGGGNGGGSVAVAVAASAVGSGAISAGIGGDAGNGSTGGTVRVATGSGAIETSGEGSSGLVVQSVGGGGGNGGYSVSGAGGIAGLGAGSVSVGLGGKGGTGGDGGTVTADLNSGVTTHRENSAGVLVQSVGGGGGNGGVNISAAGAAAAAGAGSVSVGLGGTAGAGGRGLGVTATSRGAIVTEGASSSGLVVQSIGGGGGNGGFNIGGSLSGAGTGSGAVSVGLGGAGGPGSSGGAVTAHSWGDVLTRGADSTGILAQSVGGGGGNGGFNVNVSLAGAGTGSGAIGVGLGGSGGEGAFGDTVALDVHNHVETQGASAAAVVAQSIGGGGGNGGFNVTVAGSGAGTGSGSVGVGIGGHGGDGGYASRVDGAVLGDLRTLGDDSTGLLVQSVGGGGGNGGLNVTAALNVAGTAGAAVGFGLGGHGGSGGTGGEVHASMVGDIHTGSVDERSLVTGGAGSSGFVAQSVGGGGGNGGLNVTGTLNASAGAGGAIGVGIGGSGGTGGSAGKVYAAVTGDVITLGKDATGVVAQSLGGGGGNGALNVTGSLAVSKGMGGSIAVGIGGSGGSGGSGGTSDDVELELTGNVVTDGAERSGGVFVQSLGGGGGNGGLNLSAGIALSGDTGGAVTVGIGGAGGGGAGAGEARGKVRGDVTTHGASSTAYTVQSLGGGGGNGGLNLSGGLVASLAGGASVGVGLGGSGGTASDGSLVKGVLIGDATTFGADSHGVLFQSVGGGGGHGGLNVTGGVTLAKSGAGAAAIGLGGFGGGGGQGGAVSGTVTGDVTTMGARSHGVLLQSLGGGGGSGGLSLSGGVTLGKETSGTASIGIGGFGGDGGAASTVMGEVTGTVATTGAGATGVLAQSVGGGGGDGGLNVSGTVQLSTDGAYGASIGLGGFGGEASKGETVTLTRTGATYTSGAGANGVVAQSIGGGGGNGGLDVSGTIAGSSSGSAFSASLGLGGFGGGGGAGGIVDADVIGDVIATGLGSDAWVTEDGTTKRVRTNGSHGVIAQSVGGAGGLGGLDVSGSVTADAGSGRSNSLSLGVGGFGGSGGNGGLVRLDVTADTLSAIGDERYAVAAQSIGGGGGAGGLNVSSGIALDGQVTLGVGGFGGAGGAGSDVTANVGSNLYGAGARAIGLLAQSVGGGGGAGGIDVSGGIQASKSDRPSLVLGIGGHGGTGNVAGAVSATQKGRVMVEGADSIGVLVQSVGGGGGAGGFNVSGNLGLGRSYNAAIGIGGNGGTGADAGRATLTSDGDVLVDGRQNAAPDSDPKDRNVLALAFRERANGILVQSIGGGGGAGGMNLTGVATLKGNPLAVGVGGSGGAAGDGGAVVVNRGLETPGLIATLGNDANGLTAQSIGSGGGDAGMNIVVEATLAKEQKKQSVVTLGGAGGAAGDGSTVDVTHVGTIETQGRRSDGILAQSVGGGGGNANINFGTGANKSTMGVDVVVGGSPEGGGDGGEVTVTHRGDIGTQGDDSSAIFAQSIGGGGGNAEVDDDSAIGKWLPAPQVVIDIMSDEEKSINVTVGRQGGKGGVGKAVTLTSDGTLVTSGDGSSALRAQSVGNGGGDSGTTAFTGSGDLKLDVQVGVAGGDGGHAGKVDVDAFGRIETSGQESHAIYAQSIGGGGGTGGAVTSALLQTENALSIGVGGTGGKGSWADAVTVTSHATLVTSGDGSHGIHAQSIGGGGGDGGFAGVDQSAVLDAATTLIGELFKKGETGEKKSKTSLSALVGGTGGEGGTGGTVTVTNHGTIVTAGRTSHGINAQSIGGGGGTGGMVVAGSIATDGSTNSLAVNVGGSGGDGNSAGLVTVTNDGTIHTQGTQSVGLRAVSQGGGGGDAGLLATLNIAGIRDRSTSNALTVNVGGTGGEGSAGGDVSVVNRPKEGGSDGEIVTEGDEAHGIFAQSLGGGGGNGSSIVSATFAGGQDSLSIGLSVGGTGGSGGAAGDVSVTNASAIETLGEGAAGIKAQSIGGGGGNGGLVLAANAGFATASGLSTPLVTLGGSGGKGNDAGAVTVHNSGTILTHGKSAHGIVAQSIGGGGGHAGLGLAMTNHASSTVVAGLMSALLGGRGGEGGLGGPVTVRHSGDIRVLGDNAKAVVAESINGGGGGVALDFDGIAGLPGGSGLPFDAEGRDLDPVFVFHVGGEGTTQSSAGNVTLDYTGTFGAAGDNGAGSTVQAIGGGGGTFDLRLGLRDGAGTTGGAASAIQAHGRLGGSDGVSSHGGALQSLHRGDLVTEGSGTPGLLVQSIGGGGGRASVDVTSQTGRLGASDLALGSVMGRDEPGGRIVHKQDGSIATAGAGSHGAVLQSLGGGGGMLSFALRPDSTSGGTWAPSAPVALALGAAAGDSLAAGDLWLDFDGALQTAGDHAAGLLVQSIGAGGGVATVRGATTLDAAMGGNGSARGDGGDVHLIHQGPVTTTGDRAHGLLVQSIGGGGGAVLTDVARPRVTASAGNAGDGGPIELAQLGDVATLGRASIGVLVQSLGGGGGYVDGGFAGSGGGEGVGGSIGLLLDGDVLAIGETSTAVLAQSAGGDGGSDIRLVLTANHSIVGGKGGVGVAIDGGAVNVLRNEGSIATIDGIEGYAVVGGGGNEAVVNLGTLIGSLDLGPGENRVDNAVGASLLSGAVLMVGDGNRLTNEGVLSPGGAGVVQTTALTGALLEASSAVYRIDLDLAGDRIDRVEVTGAADLAGQVTLKTLNVPSVVPGTRQLRILGATGGVTDSGLTLAAAESAVAGYALVYPSPTEVALGLSVDFAPDGLNRNQTAIGEYFNRVQYAGSSPALASIVTALFDMPSSSALARAYDRLSPEAYASLETATVLSDLRFRNTLFSCPVRDGALRFAREGECVWLDVYGLRQDSEATDESAGYDWRAVSATAGIQKAIADDWRLGLVLSYEHSEIDVDDLAEIQGDAIRIGATLKRLFGGTTVGGALTGGAGAYDAKRYVDFPGPGVRANGDQDLRFIGAQLRLAHDFERGDWYLRPLIDAGVTYFQLDSFEESGAGAASLRVESRNETYVSLRPALEIGGEIAMGDGTLVRPRGRLGITQLLSGAGPEVVASLEGAPSVRPFVVERDLDSTYLDVELGVEVLTKGGATLRASYMGQLSEHTDGHGVMLKVSVPF